MQQYFYDKKLNVEDIISLDEEIIFHLKKVLRKDEDYIFRIVDNRGIVFLCNLVDNKGHIIEELDDNNELDVDITVILSLIKNDKFELCIQKLTELGVNKIIPYQAKRSIIKGKLDNKLIRYQKIIKEAAEQSLRNKIPFIRNTITIKDIKNYLSELNIVAYEKEDSENNKIDLNKKSITIIIGPEGGFELEEINELNKLGFINLSLGKRILRAETAAIYLTSLIVGENQ